jgi:hypothetical protein
VIHIAAAPDPPRHSGRAYYRRKLAAGKKPLEAMRCLKRRISDAIYRQLVADDRAVAADVRSGSGRAPRGVSISSAAGSTPAHRHFGSATSRTRTNDATRGDDRTGRDRP